MNSRAPGEKDIPPTKHRSRNAPPYAGLCTRGPDGYADNCEVFESTLRGHKANSPEIDTTAVYGHLHPVRLRMPIITDVFGSSGIARKHWHGLAAGAAVSGIALVVGENACGLDHGLELDGHGRVARSPELEQLVKLYQEWKEQYGDLIVQINVENTRLGLAEYAVRELGVETIELKWGQAARCIGGEIKIRDLDCALQWRRRGLIVIPDPEDPAIQAAFRAGAIREFERHCRPGFIDEEKFRRNVEHLRQVGAKRVALKTGAGDPRELALAIKWASKARVDLLTIDGAGSGSVMGSAETGQEGCVPTFSLQGMACNFAKKLAARGERIPHLAMAGGFSTEDQLFKVLAQGSPYFRAVFTSWSRMMSDSVEGLSTKYGKTSVDRMPPGTLDIYTHLEKLRSGLTRLMAGARSSRLDMLKRDHVRPSTEDASRLSGIPCGMDHAMEEAEQILQGD